ncbi:helix-turn-helix domain-containing protein [Microlunatus parietis]|uniref:Transcriptional regulator GlxA family with amidase domain n=1 Tax=Microlunatus parietis TaxID=682979 RepID=A0A7Y9IDD7_9ACTN|nr:helix-turn-helix domain-containing protein [Microlunatus parietis]NYE74750.1 transcriptional regulator GlxA family with amidase domain [Microlunatus parietis]
MPTAAILAFDGISPFHLSVPALVFGRAGIDRPDCWPYRLRICAERPGGLETEAGFAITVPYGLEALDDLSAGAPGEPADLLIVPSWRRDAVPSERLLDAIRAAHRRGARIVGLCLGGWVVAASGLANGRELTTHWSDAERLARAHPAVRVRADLLWSDLGDVITSAGVAAALDCCLHLVRTDLGSRAAAELARRLVLAPHRSGSQAQFFPVAVPPAEQEDPIERAMVWATARLPEPIDLDAWARAATLSRRTFTRRFRDRTGTSPQQWLLHQRLDRARLLLETTDDPVERVAVEAGFATAVSLRHHFRAQLGTSPAAHRAQFGTRSLIKN